MVWMLRTVATTATSEGCEGRVSTELNAELLPAVCLR